MKTYKIRTHNPYYLSFAYLIAVVVPIFTIISLVPHGISIKDYLISNGYMRFATSLPYWFIIYFFAFGTFCNYFICTFIEVKVSDEGVSTVWFSKSTIWFSKNWFFAHKVEKTIKWDEIEKFDYFGWGSIGIGITTKTKENFMFRSIYFITIQRDFKEFIKDFEARYQENKNKRP